jgi:hypothetical protein
MLRGARGKRATDLAVQCTALPKSAGLVEEVAICDDSRRNRVLAPMMIAS